MSSAFSIVSGNRNSKQFGKSGFYRFSNLTWIQFHLSVPASYINNLLISFLSFVFLISSLLLIFVIILECFALFAPCVTNNKHIDRLMSFDMFSLYFGDWCCWNTKCVELIKLSLIQTHKKQKSEMLQIADGVQSCQSSFLYCRAACIRRRKKRNTIYSITNTTTNGINMNTYKKILSRHLRSVREEHFHFAFCILTILTFNEKIKLLFPSYRLDNPFKLICGGQKNIINSQWPILMESMTKKTWSKQLCQRIAERDWVPKWFLVSTSISMRNKLMFRF